MIRVAVIGTGVMGSNHARVITTLPGTELVGLFDEDYDKCVKQASKFSTSALRSIEESIECADAVIIATPTPTHINLMRRCIDSNRHFLVEKPVCISEAEFKSLPQTPKDLIAMVGHVERFNPAVRYARTMDLGQVVSISARREGPYSPRILEGVTRDLMIHDIDLCAYLTGERFSVVGAGCKTALSNSEDISAAILKGESGLIASLLASRIGQTKIRDIRLTTNEYLLHLDLLQRIVLIYRQSSASFTESSTPLYTESLTTQMPILNGFGEPLAAELECFIKSIEMGHLHSDAASLLDAVDALSIANTIAVFQ
jgi:predicted dehydrogenase